MNAPGAAVWANSKLQQPHDAHKMPSRIDSLWAFRIYILKLALYAYLHKLKGNAYIGSQH